ncbi:3-deoxy-manno-octulosonate cytidylyltransferase [Fulvivirga imtechensis AK7]|uniref:3-deoxy-manno-octulosonate cytidylyltransferase n=1 Tax=Fulvivirga imtechensis AK7 TaxID=1237149 RepID=L8JTB8_9BACT|nr:glycosyltransferase family protein [Fulvivirga imtechensis]ELR70587.1 3-deoxy-manno-octulosonate cytidylyltransferase [Fulvivirga imtechensis AK7]
MRIIAITQARYGSTRLPGKVLKEVKGATLLEIHLKRILRAKKIDDVIVATTNEPEADKISKIAAANHVEVYQGSTDDVLDRFYNAARVMRADWVVRLTSDCPLIDPELIDLVIEKTLEAKADYGTNTFENLFPDGQDIEVFSFESLKMAWEDAKLQSEMEHVTPYIRKNTNIEGGKLFKGFSYKCGTDYSKVRMTVDEPADLRLTEVLIGQLGVDQTWLKYTEYILENDLGSINASILRNEGYIKSLKNDKKQI